MGPVTQGISPQEWQNDLRTLIDHSPLLGVLIGLQLVAPVRFACADAKPMMLHISSNSATGKTLVLNVLANIGSPKQMVPKACNWMALNRMPHPTGVLIPESDCLTQKEIHDLTYQLSKPRGVESQTFISAGERMLINRLPALDDCVLEVSYCSSKDRRIIQDFSDEVEVLFRDLGNLKYQAVVNTKAFARDNLERYMSVYQTELDKINRSTIVQGLERKAEMLAWLATGIVMATELLNLHADEVQALQTELIEIAWMTLLLVQAA